MDELELINGFELVKECIIKMCNNINIPISIPILKWNINTRYTIICDEHHINEIITGPKYGIIDNTFNITVIPQ